LNDRKYDLMQLNQSLGMITPSSDLAKELQNKRAALQQEIDKLEADLKRSEATAQLDNQPKKFKKVVSDDGKVKIMRSSQ